MNATEFNVLLLPTDYDDDIGPIFTMILDNESYKITLKVSDGTITVINSKSKNITLLEACKNTSLVFYYVLSEIYSITYEAVSELEQKLAESRGMELNVLDGELSPMSLTADMPIDKKQIN